MDDLFELEEIQKNVNQRQDPSGYNPAGAMRYVEGASQFGGAEDNTLTERTSSQTIPQIAATTPRPRLLTPESVAVEDGSRGEGLFVEQTERQAEALPPGASQARIADEREFFPQ